jgi:hypothetical protein
MPPRRSGRHQSASIAYKKGDIVEVSLNTCFAVAFGMPLEIRAELGSIDVVPTGLWVNARYSPF